MPGHKPIIIIRNKVGDWVSSFAWQLLQDSDNKKLHYVSALSFFC